MAIFRHMHVERHFSGTLTTFLFHSLEEGTEGELSAAARCTEFVLFRALRLLVIHYSRVLLPFSILRRAETNSYGRITY